jgi:ribokinase
MRVFNFGSLNIDHVYAVEAFVRAGQTIASRGYSQHAGGKGANQSAALAAAGADTRHVGAVGPEGRWLIDRLTQAGVDTRWIAQREDRATGHAIIQVSPEGENAIVLHAGANHGHDPEAMRAAPAQMAQKGDLWLVQNETDSVVESILGAADAGLIVAANPAPMSQAVRDWPLDRLSVLIVNESEAEALTGQTDAESALRRLRGMCPGADLLLTLGAHGGVQQSPAEDAIRRFEAANAGPTVDTTAAGDCFVGYYLAGLAQGLAVSERIELARWAAALSVTRQGAIPSIPTRDEVDALRRG